MTASACATDWKEHKKYCGKLVYLSKSKLQAFYDSETSANTAQSEVFNAAMQAAENDQVKHYVRLTAFAAESLVKHCQEDVLPSCTVEEQV